MTGCGSIRRCIQRELRPAATSVSLGASSTTGSTGGSGGGSSSGSVVVSDEISTTSITTDDIFATTATIGRIKGYIRKCSRSRQRTRCRASLYEY